MTTRRRVQQALDTSTSSEETLVDTLDVDAGGRHTCRQLEDSRKTILNYKLLEIKYSKLLKLFAESTRQLGEAHERLILLRQEKDSEIDTLKLRIHELEASTPDIIIPTQHSHSDSEMLPSGCNTPNFNKEFMHHFGGPPTAQIECQTDITIVQQLPLEQNTDSPQIKIQVVEPTESIPEQAENVFAFAMRLDPNHLSVQSAEKPNRRPENAEADEHSEQSVRSRRSSCSDRSSQPSEDSFDEEDGHIYTPRTENRLYAFGNCVAQVNNFFTLASEDFQPIKEVNEDDMISECASGFQDNKSEVSAEEQSASKPDIEQKQGSLRKKRNQAPIQIKIHESPILPVSRSDQKVVPLGSPKNMVRAVSQEPHSALLSLYRTPIDEEQVRSELKELRKLTKSRSATAFQPSTASSIAGDEGLDLIAEEFRTHHRNYKLLEHPYYLGAISVLLLLLVLYVPI